jgi:hypothetical protein
MEELFALGEGVFGFERPGRLSKKMAGSKDPALYGGDYPSAGASHVAL